MRQSALELVFAASRRRRRRRKPPKKLSYTHTRAHGRSRKHSAFNFFLLLFYFFFFKR